VSNVCNGIILCVHAISSNINGQLFTKITIVNTRLVYKLHMPEQMSMYVSVNNNAVSLALSNIQIIDG